MVARAACREYVTRFGAALAVACVMGVTATQAQAPPPVQGPPAPKPPRDAEAAVANARDLVDPVKRCKPAEDGSITVCGSDTDRHRLPPELRAIAGVGRSTKTAIPDAPKINPTVWDQLPYSWMSIGGGAKSGPEYNPLYEMTKRATDPETGVPAAPEEPEP